MAVTWKKLAFDGDLTDHAADADAHGEPVVTCDTDSATADDLAFSIVGGEGIDTSGATSVVTITGEDASTSNKGIVMLDTTPADEETKAPTSKWAYDHDADTDAHHAQAHESSHIKGGADDIDSALDARAIALTTRGDIPYVGETANTLARLAKGTEGYVLTMGANDPAWAEATGGSASEPTTWAVNKNWFRPVKFADACSWLLDDVRSLWFYLEDAEATYVDIDSGAMKIA